MVFVREWKPANCAYLALFAYCTPMMLISQCQRYISFILGAHGLYVRGYLLTSLSMKTSWGSKCATGMTRHIPRRGASQEYYRYLCETERNLLKGANPRRKFFIYVKLLLKKYYKKSFIICKCYMLFMQLYRRCSCTITNRNFRVWTSISSSCSSKILRSSSKTQACSCTICSTCSSSWRLWISTGTQVTNVVHNENVFRVKSVHMSQIIRSIIWKDLSGSDNCFFVAFYTLKI